MANLDLSKLDSDQLVSLALVRRRLVQDAEEQLAEVASALLQLEPRQYTGTNPGEKVTVVPPVAPGVKITALEDDAAAVAAAREICGDSFKLLFERRTTFAPKEDFAGRIAVLFKAPERRKLLDLVEVPTKGKAGYVLYPKK